MPLISINGAHPVWAPHEAPWHTAEGYPRTNAEEWTQDADFMALGPAEIAPPPPAYDSQTERLAWTGEAWTVEPYTPPPPPVPDRVTNFQARAALLEAGLFGTVNDALLALPVDSPERQAWEYANELTRYGALVNGMANQLGLTGDQLDALFRRAAEIEA